VKALEKRKPRRGATADSGQLGSARTDSREEQGFEVGEASGTVGVLPHRPRVTGKCFFGSIEREAIVVGGIRQPRASVGVEETGDERSERQPSRALVDDYKGACGLERGARFL